MLPRRHLFFCLIALTTLGGCKTKLAQTPSAAVTEIGPNHGSSSDKQSVRHAASNDSATAHSTEAAPSDPVGASLLAIPPLASKLAPTSENTKANAGVSAARTNPTGQSNASSLPAANQPRDVAVDTPPSPPEKPAQPAPIGITVSPVALSPARPVARLALASSLTSTPEPPNAPRPISLPNLFTGTPTAPRLSAVITAPSLTAVSPTQSKSQSLDLLSHLASAQVASGNQDQPQSWNLPLATDTTPIPAARFDQTTLLPLPVTATVLFQPKGAPIAPIPGLAERVPPIAPPPPPDSAAARENREILHQKVYQFLLGQP